MLRARALRDEAGFTLVELLVVVVILGLVGAVTATAVVQGYRASAEAQNRLDTLAEAQNALANVTRDLRAACPLQSVTADTIDAIVRDRGAGGETRRVVVQLAGTDLQVTTYDVAADGTETLLGVRALADNVESGIFTATDVNGDPAVTADTTDRIQVSIRLLAEGSGDRIEFQTGVNMRNRGVTQC